MAKQIVADYDVGIGYTIDLPEPISSVDVKFPKKFMQDIKDRYENNSARLMLQVKSRPVASHSMPVSPIVRSGQCSPQHGFHNNIKIVFSTLPNVVGDVHDGEMDDCNYQKEIEIKALKKDAKRISKIEPSKFTEKAKQTKDDKAMLKQARNKMYRKSRSVMPPQSILKKADSIRRDKKKVQFNTKKTVFRYNPHK